MKLPSPKLCIVASLVLAAIGIGYPTFASAPMPAADKATLNQELIDAAAQGQLDTVTLDVYRGADVNATDRYKRSPLTACAGGEGPEATRLKIVKLLVGLGADVNQHSVFQPTALLNAIDYNQTQIASYLLSNGADPASFDSQGDCALTHAARTGQTDMIKALLARGADVRSTDHKGRTPLMWASGKPSSEPDYSAFDEEMPSETGYTVIRCVHSHGVDLPGGSDVVRALVAAGSPIDAMDNEGNTALMIAAHGGKTEIVQALIEAHADWKLRNDLSDTALMCAEKAAHAETVSYLKSVGGGNDPLFLALEKRLTGAKSLREREIAAIAAKQSTVSQSDLPGLSLKVYADKEFVTDGSMPKLHYILENKTSSPITIISPSAVDAKSPSAAKAAWSIALVDSSHNDHPGTPQFASFGATGRTVSAVATIGVITVPANGHIEVPVAANLTSSETGESAIATPGVYRAAFFYVGDPSNMPYSTDEVHQVANRTAPCKLISNEITIVND